jgi:4-hydroxyphenylpyruvate dioxygenase
MKAQANQAAPWEGPILENPCGIEGLEFVEFSIPKDDGSLEKLFDAFGLQCVAKHRRKEVFLYKQNDIHFILNKEPESFASRFAQKHGKSIPALGFRVKDADLAHTEAVRRGARDFSRLDIAPGELRIPAIYSVGDSLVYFVDRHGNKLNSLYEIDFEQIENPKSVKSKGLLRVDHLTNNVRRGAMDQLATFYATVLGFRQIRYFDIKGLETGLLSRALLSPSKNFAIPINEPTESKSQIQEYIDEYKGEGVQHLALLTDDIISTVRDLRAAGLQFLDVPDTYYEMLPARVPHVTEDLNELKKLRILVDGDEKGYLLQLFTSNIMGPIFVEIIQRKNHYGFGEGNFQALFDSIERDQKRRGVL